jgi:hypothetical protein
MKNIVECQKEFFAYFNALKTYSGYVYLWYVTCGMYTCGMYTCGIYTYAKFFWQIFWPIIF